MITRAQIAATFFLALFCGSVFAQIDIADAIRTSETSKPTLAIYDIRPANSSITAIQNAIERAFKVHYDRLKITQQLAPSPLPVVPPRPTFKYVQGQLGTFLYPDCPQASTIVFAMDVTMLKYGEMTILRACVFQYQEGLRLSIYANFTQKSGAVSPRSNLKDFL